MSLQRRAASRRVRAIRALLGAFACFALVLGVSRLVDLGLIEGDTFGAGDWRRSTTGLRMWRERPEDGVPRTFGQGSALVAGEELRFSYGRTRYLYLWIFRIDADGAFEVLVPSADGPRADYGYRVNPAGEVLSTRYRIRPNDDGAVIAGFLSGLPYQADQIRAAAKAVERQGPGAIVRGLPVSGQRFIRRLHVEPQ
ncbi:MAG: hypothetical protein IPK13_20520 [Deltaproteobacteria bacterium]|nr:hypothetical protein [Deltaproteobacteria bacterium]